MRGGRVRIKLMTVASITFPAAELDQKLTLCGRSAKQKLLLTLLSDGAQHPVS